MKIRYALLLSIIVSVTMSAQIPTSVTGFFPLKGSGRIVYNFNQGWRFLLGDTVGAEKKDFDDSHWQIVCAPHTVQLVPSEASGCRNYQGVAWYRKHFTVPEDMKGKIVTVHFEAIMGKQSIYVNGTLVKEHLGGYLPITIDLTKEGVKAGDKCVIAVKADNSDDGTYPPGKKQTALDFCYHGGMYRDVWLIGKSAVAITDAIEAKEVAGGGLFIHYGDISEKSAQVMMNVEVENASKMNCNATVIAKVKNANDKIVSTLKGKLTLKTGGKATAILQTTVDKPHLWSPEDPYLYLVELTVSDGKNVCDGGIARMGIRKVEFRGKDGLWLNGKPYHQLIGGNRHQDFAIVGNAVTNSQQWRDAKRLRDAGMMIVRAAHYPQDPAFMDACDELGLFVIVPTPGWQYWGKDAQFAELVYKNTRDIIRRDRNHPCVMMWEPILNETHFPKDFALKSLQITKDEYPYPGRPAAAADMSSAGVKENYDVMYGWPEDVGKETTPAGKCIFTREFGEYVDDWYAHNAINRSSRGWGEKPMLMQALSLADTYGLMFHSQRQFIGGCQWHPFDHQRGYHPDPYYGGIYDAFRQKKYAYEMFRSQTQYSGPSVFIANEMTPFSDSDVVVFSNCDSVRLTLFGGAKTQILPVVHKEGAIPYAPVTFKGFWNFNASRELSYKKHNWEGVTMVADGIKDGKVVCSEKKMPSRRSTKIRLSVDSLGKALVADGSDFIVVVAEITDDNGNVRRLAKEEVLFSVEGEGRIIGDATISANPRAVEWGSAPVLVQSTNRAGNIRIIARSLHDGTYAPASDTITVTSIPASIPSCYSEQPDNGDAGFRPMIVVDRQRLSIRERNKILKEVEQQQKDFGVK
jgi:beta-galactosidase